jgi:hypothetical protein
MEEIELAACFGGLEGGGDGFDCGFCPGLLLLLGKSKCRRGGGREDLLDFVRPLYMVTPLERRISHSSNPKPALPPVTTKARLFSELGGYLLL